MTTGTNPAMLWEYYNRNLLETLYKKLQFYPLGEKTNMPETYGTQAKWLRYQRLNSATTPLTQGVPPSETSINTFNVTATINQYGAFIRYSDLLKATAIDRIEGANKVLAEQGAETIDTVIINELDGSTIPNQFANNKPNLANTGATDVMTAKEILKAVVTLKKNLVGPHTGSDYVSVIHSACTGDVQNDTNIGSWVDLNKYIEPSKMRPFTGEMGKVYGCRVLESQNISSTTAGTLGGATVYANYVLGSQCFGVVLLNGKSVEQFVKETGSAGSLDPINQVGTIGWKAKGFAAKYLGGAAVGTSDLGVRVRAGSQF